MGLFLDRYNKPNICQNMMFHRWMEWYAYKKTWDMWGLVTGELQQQINSSIRKCTIYNYRFTLLKNASTREWKYEGHVEVHGQTWCFIYFWPIEFEQIKSEYILGSTFICTSHRIFPMVLPWLFDAVIYSIPQKNGTKNGMVGWWSHHPHHPSIIHPSSQQQRRGCWRTLTARISASSKICSTCSSVMSWKILRKPQFRYIDVSTRNFYRNIKVDIIEWWDSIMIGIREYQLDIIIGIHMIP